MIQNNVTVPAVIEIQQESKSSYSAPELFAVGETVDLIQGAQWRGPADWRGSWPIWPL